MRTLFLFIASLCLLATPVRAQVATDSALATLSAEVATPAAQVEPPAEEKTDLTQPTKQVGSRLEQLLTDNPAGDLSWNNFLRYFVERAVSKGLPVNTVVLILLFPLVVALVAASRHLVGVRGVGILTPALLSVSFLATGIWAGMGLFLVILLVATTGRILLRRLKLQYLPRMALLLWLVSTGVLLALLSAAEFNIGSFLTIGIFPILILMLLAESFIDIQQTRSAAEAREIIVQTFVLAMISSLVLAWEMVQKTVLLFPELVYLGVAGFDVLLGKYTGLRLTEYFMYSRVEKGEDEE